MSKKYVDLEKCTSQFRDIFERYKAIRKSQMASKKPPTIQMLLDERKKQVIDNQTEEEYLTQEFVENLRDQEEISEFLARKSKKQELVKLNAKIQEKRHKFTKLSLLQTMIIHGDSSMEHGYTTTSPMNEKPHIGRNSGDLILPTIENEKRKVNNVNEKTVRKPREKGLQVENTLGYIQTRSTKENSISNNEQYKNMLKRSNAFSSKKLKNYLMKKQKVSDALKEIYSIEDNARKHEREYHKNLENYHFGAMILKKKFEYTLGKLS